MPPTCLDPQVHCEPHGQEPPLPPDICSPLSCVKTAERALLDNKEAQAERGHSRGDLWRTNLHTEPVWSPSAPAGRNSLGGADGSVPPATLVLLLHAPPGRSAKGVGAGGGYKETVGGQREFAGWASLRGTREARGSGGLGVGAEDPGPAWDWRAPGDTRSARGRGEILRRRRTGGSGTRRGPGDTGGQ